MADQSSKDKKREAVKRKNSLPDRHPTLDLGHSPTDTALVNLDVRSLSGKSRDELIAIILALKTQLPKDTGPLYPEVVERALVAVAQQADSDIDEYIELPTKKEHEDSDIVGRPRHIALIDVNLKHDPLRFKIRDDVFIGREAGGIVPDIDLTDYGAADCGVSRQHALLRPTKDSLHLIDLDSTNGTFRNGTRLRSGSAESLKDNDLISFGTLHFKLRITESPWQPQKGASIRA